LGSADGGSSLGHCCLPGTHTFCPIVEFLVFGIREYRGGGVVLAVLGHDGGLGRVAMLRYASPFILITAQRDDRSMTPQSDVEDPRTSEKVVRLANGRFNTLGPPNIKVNCSLVVPVHPSNSQCCPGSLLIHSSSLPAIIIFVSYETSDFCPCGNGTHHLGTPRLNVRPHGKVPIIQAVWSFLYVKATLPSPDRSRCRFQQMPPRTG
jgi:hypothetical protein